MSDQAFRTALEQMEAWLADAAWEPEAESLALWESDFNRLLATTEKGVDWPELQLRAHAAGKRLEARAAEMKKIQDGIRAELEMQERGNRALKGYRTRSQYLLEGNL